MKFQWQRFRGRYCFLLIFLFLALILYMLARFSGLPSFHLQSGYLELSNHAYSYSLHARPVTSSHHTYGTPQAGMSHLLDNSDDGNKLKRLQDATRNSNVSLSPTTLDMEDVYRDRVDRMRNVCSKDDMIYLKFFRNVNANRRHGKTQGCKTKLCPVIVDEKHALFYCFIPKIASTVLKKFFLKINNISINSSVESDSTALHMLANSALYRVSPAYFPQTTLRRFYKILFVRHPFDRLVSAFRDKGERSRKEVSYFYKFWDPVMKAQRGENVTADSRPTFQDFVWYLLHTYVGKYENHWAPYWSRCQPCHVDYDFIGKLETAHLDFPYVFQQMGLEEAGEFIQGIDTSREITLRYFKQIPSDDIMRLYNIYRLDFEIFGYTLDGLLPQSS